ncbi:MAG TPA: heparinase II/III family protein, partial [Steroidobacteraceae bacterium]
MQSLTWYVHRLGRMSIPELCYRALQMGRIHATRLARIRAVPEPHPARPISFIDIDARVEVALYIARAERIMEGCFDIFDLENVQLGHPPVWNRDPLTGRIAPLRHASTIDYRDERVVGNIKYLWEPSRHLHVPALAQAYALTKDARYAEAMRLHIESWIEQCPPHMGAHWTSSLELAIRLINWSIAWQLIGGERSSIFDGQSGAAFRQRWMESVFLQARAIVNNLSRFSSANNHLIGETAGVWIASVIWNGWPKLQRWGERCAAILEREILRQNAPDGGNREQAFAYQQFVLDFALLSGLAARVAGRDFSKDYWARLEAMIDFIASIMDVGGNMPMVGDADDGYVVRLAPESGLGARSSGLGQEGLRESWPHTASNAMKNLGARDLELGLENREDRD